MGDEAMKVSRVSLIENGERKREKDRKRERGRDRG